MPVFGGSRKTTGTVRHTPWVRLMTDLPVRFNPARVSEYRKRILPARAVRREDSAAGEIPAEEPTPRLAFWCLVAFMFFSYAQLAAWLPGHPNAELGTGLHGLARIAATMRLSLVPAVVGLVAVIVYKERFLFTRYQMWFMAAFVCCAFLSTPLALWRSRALEFATSEVMKLFLLLLLTINVIRNTRGFRTFLWAVALCGCVVAIGTLARNALGDTSIFKDPSGRIGWAGYFQNPNSVALAMCMLIPVGLSLVELSTSLPKKAAALGLVALYAVVMLKMLSRGAMVSFACIVLVYVLSSKKKLRNLLIVMVLGVATLAMNKEVLERAKTIATYRQDASVMSRLDLWKAGIAITLRNPVTLAVGIGGKCFTAATINYFPATTRGLRGMAPHNTYIEVLAELGVLGLTVFLALVGVTLRDGWRLQKRFRNATDQEARDMAKMARAVFLALIAILVTGLTHHFAYEWLLYMFIGLMVSLKQMARRYDVYV